MTSRKRSKDEGDCGTDVYMREGTTSRVMAADRPCSEFYHFTESIRNILDRPSYNAFHWRCHAVAKPSRQTASDFLPVYFTQFPATKNRKSAAEERNVLLEGRWDRS